MAPLLRPALVLFLIMTVLTGVLYPLAVTTLAQLLFNDQAMGSLVVAHGRPVGSHLIGQAFSSPKYFWGRPSASTPEPYNATASTGSNLGPLNPALIDAVKGRIEALRAADPANPLPIPVDLVTASGSGLDPDISLAAARYQVRRVARARGLEPAAVQLLLDTHARGRFLGLIGEPRVNVLELNLALDAQRAPKAGP
jgi:K+-transporting ATPase ATPase C chain